jgi:hypothetical protein
MQPAEVIEALLALADETDLEVKHVGGAQTEWGSAATSAVCKVRGRTWVVLSGADPVSVQLGVLGRALRNHAGELLENRYLPPAVRQWIVNEDSLPNSRSGDSAEDA